MASLRSSTTSSPSQSVALKPLVQVTRIPCRAHDKRLVGNNIVKQYNNKTLVTKRSPLETLDMKGKY